MMSIFRCFPLLVFFLAFAADVSAADLVSNTGEDVKEYADGRDVAQAFTTGSNGYGFTLESVGVFIEVQGQDGSGAALVDISIYTESSGNPGTLIANLGRHEITMNDVTKDPEAPGEEQVLGRGVVEFDAPAGVELDAATTYMVVYDIVSRAGKYYSTSAAYTESNSQTGETGWTIADAAKQRLENSNSLTDFRSFSDSILIIVKGEEYVPAFSVDDVRIREGGGTANFTVSLDRTPTSAVSVDYATRDGTATAGLDYTAITTTTLNFAANESTKTVSVPITDDNVVENEETFSLVLSNPSSGTRIADGEGTGTGTIFDIPAFSIDDVRIREGDGTADFTVSVDRPPMSAISVDYATSDGTATAGTDYTAIATTTLNFAANETSKTISVTIADDRVMENDETFTVTLSNPSSGTKIADDTGMGTIFDSGTVLISVDDATATEGDGTMRFRVSLDQASTGAITATWSTADGTAKDGLDFATDPRLNTVSFKANEVEQFIQVVVLEDSDVEPAETFTVILSGATGGSIDDGEATGTLLDNDVAAIEGTPPVFVQPPPPGAPPPPPRVSVADARAFEDTLVMEFMVTLDVPALGGETLDYGTVDGTASAGEDYSATMGTLTFDEGETSKTVAVPLVYDFLDEEDETMVLRLSNVRELTVEDSEGIGTIRNRERGDPASRLWLSRFGRTVATHIVDAISRRVSVEQSTAMWGQLNSGSFDGSEGSVSLTGDVVGGIAGMDRSWGKWRAGLAVSYSEGDGSASDDVSLDGHMTTLMYYGRYALSQRMQAWGLVGYGEGDMGIRREGRKHEQDTEMQLGALGTRGALLSHENPFSLDLKADVFLADIESERNGILRSADAQTSRARISLEGSRSFQAG